MKTIYLILFIFVFSYSCIAQSFTFPASGDPTLPLTAPDGVTLVSSISSTGCTPGPTSTFVYSTSHVSTSAIYRNTRWAAGCKNSTDLIKLDFSTVNTRPLSMKFSIYDVDNGADSVSVKIYSEGLPVDYTYQLFSPTYVTANGLSPAMGFHGSGTNNSGLDDNSGRIEISTVNPIIRIDSILIYKHNNSDGTGNPSQSFAAFDWSGSIALPIKLVSFSAYQNDDVIQFRWKVNHEAATREYQIEFSANNNSYSQVGITIPAKGTLTGEVNYSYAMLPPSHTKILYFRLVSIDADGKKYFSNTIKVSRNQWNKSDVYPTIFKNSFSVAIHSDYSGTGNLKLISMDGRIIYQKTVSISKGHTLIPVAISSDITKGIYLVSGEFGKGLSFRHSLIKE